MLNSPSRRVALLWLFVALALYASAWIRALQKRRRPADRLRPNILGWGEVGGVKALVMCLCWPLGVIVALYAWIKHEV